MKKKWKKILLFSIASVMLCGCQPDVDDASQEDPTEENQNMSEEKTEKKLPYDFTEEGFLKLRDFTEYAPKIGLSGVKKDGQYFQLSNIGDYTVMQGGCTDGTYMYLALENTRTTPHTDIIFKVDMETWEIAAQSEILELDHANSLTYNSKLHSLIVAHGTGTPKDISFVNPDTLQITGRKTLERDMYSIVYNEEKDCYVAGFPGTTAFAILDSNFVELAYCKGHSVGLGNQSIETDENYIYIGNSGVVQNPGVEMVKVYNWDGDYEGVFRWDTVSEQEALIKRGDELYVTFFTGNGGRVFKADKSFDDLNR